MNTKLHTATNLISTMLRSYGKDRAAVIVYARNVYTLKVTPDLVVLSRSDKPNQDMVWHNPINAHTEGDDVLVIEFSNREKIRVPVPNSVLVI